MITQEYTTLIREGEVMQEILPNVEFSSIEPGCIVTAYALVKDDSGGIVCILQPGQVTDKLKETPKMDYELLTVSELRELCISNEIFFPAKAKKARLIELLQGA